MALQQYSIYTVEILSGPPQENPEREWTVAATRQEAEAIASDEIAKHASKIYSCSIEKRRVLVTNSPKRAFLEGLRAGLNSVGIHDSLGSANPEVVAVWKWGTGWLIKDERSASRRPVNDRVETESD
jgi:hypothetical protein